MATNIKLKRSATSGATPSTSDLELGELALNTYDGKMYMKKTVSGSSSIVELTGTVAASSSAFAYQSFKFTASSSQTTFTGSDADSKTLAYTAGQIQVYLNGVLLDATDYTASNGSSVVLGSAAASGDILMVLNYSGTNPFDYFKYTATNAQTTFSGNDANSESLVYTVGNITVHLNGVLLDATDYTATSGTSVVLASGASSGDILVIHEFNETALTDVSADTTPQLSGNLDVNGNDIVSVSNGDIDIKPHGSGNIVLDNHTWPNSDGSSGQFLKTNGSGTLSFDTVSSAADDLTTGDSAVSLATSAGNITIDAQGNDTDIIFKGTDNSSDITMLTLDGSDAGTAIFNHDIKLGDSSEAIFGASTDLRIAHDSTDSFMTNNTGDLYINQLADDKDILLRSDDGSGGIATYITIDGSATKTIFNKTAKFGDNTELQLGNDNDLVIKHNATNSVIQTTTGDLILQSDGDDVKILSEDDVVIRDNDDSTEMAKFINGGAVELYHNGSKKVETASDGIDVTGHISIGGSNNELRFYEGSNYVGFEAPALSGDQIWVLPAADGSANQVIKTDGSGNLSFADAAATVTGLTDTTISSAASGDYLRYNGSAWVNVASAGNPVVDTMTGDASDTTLTLTRAPLHENAVQVYWDGVYQTKDNWAVSGTTLTFDTAPPSGVKVEAVTGSQTNILYGNDVTIDKMTGDGSDTTLSLSVTPSNENHTNVYFDGVYQSKDNYTLSGTTITFSTAPPTGVLVEAVSNQAVSIGTATGIAASALTGLTEVTAADADHVLIYDASGSALKKALVSDFAKNTTEEIQDIVGGMVSSNTETGIAVSYEDGDGTLDFVLATAQPTVTSLGTLTTLTVDDITINGSTISDAADLSIDVGADLTLDAGGGDIILSDDGTIVGTLSLNNNSGDFYIRSRVSDKDMLFRGNDGGTEITALTLDMSDAGTATFNHDVKLGDDSILSVGDGTDLQLYHDGTDSIIKNTVGHLYITTSSDDKDIIFQCDDGSGGLTQYIRVDGSVGLTQFDKDTKHVDSVKALFGAGEDLQIYHDGTHSYVKDNGVGNLILQGSNLRLAETDNTAYAFFTSGAGGEFYYDGSKKFETASGGVTVTGDTDTDTLTVSGNATVGGTLGVTGALTANAGVVVDNITIDGTEIDLSSGDLTLDVAGDIYLDADGGDLVFRDGGTDVLHITNNSGSTEFYNTTSDGDILFKGNDGGSTITALTLDMSGAGNATFNGHVYVSGNLYAADDIVHSGDTNTYMSWDADNLTIYNGGVNNLYMAAGESVFNEGSGDVDFRVESNGNANMLKVDGGNDRVSIGGGGGSAEFNVAKSAYIEQVALTSSSNAVTWDADAAGNAYHLTTENTTIGKASNGNEGQIIMIEIAQGGTARTIAWHGDYEFAASTAPTMTATANKTDIYTFRYNGGVWQEIGRVQNLAQS